MLVISTFAALLQFSQSILNPDWFSYQYIYETKGAWLSEQGRDPVFLLLTEFLADLFGPQGYESYRYFLAAYFFIFVVLVSLGRVFRLSLTRGGSLLFLVALVYLGFTRFTIQIREGLALTLVVFALALICKRSYANSRITNVFGVLFLLVLGGLVHAATLSFLAIYLAAIWITQRRRGRVGESFTSTANQNRLGLLWIGAFFIAVFGVAQLHLGGSLEQLAAETSGDRLIEPKPLSGLQLGLWGLYGAVCWMIFREVRSSVKTGQIKGTFSSFLQILSGPASVAAYISILLALTLAVAPLFVVSYVRLLHMFLALSLFLLSVSGHRSWSLIFVGVFLIADQMRSILDAISIHSGVELLL